MAVDQARQVDRDSRLAAVQQQLIALGRERRELHERQEHTGGRLAAAEQAHCEAAGRLETAREQLRLASQQADRLQGALEALGGSLRSR